MNKNSNLNKFLTFWEKDFFRSLKVIGAIIGVFIIAHLGSAIYSIHRFNTATIAFLKGTKAGDQYKISTSLDQLLSSSYIMPVMLLSFVVIVLYTIVLWNREWTGFSNTSYTLLTLPIKRVYILISKILTIVVFLGINLIIQISTLFIDKLLMKIMIAKEYLVDISVLGNMMGIYRYEAYSVNGLLSFLSLDIITMWLSFLLALSLIIILGLIVFLYRSFRLKGLALGVIILYTHVVAYLYIPLFLNFYFYERVYYNALYPLLISILGFIWSNHLLEKKVTI